MHEIAIIGSGPAGYTAGIYAGRANLSPVLFEGLESGGQLMLTTDVENYPGFEEGIMGPELMQVFKKQAQKFGTEIKTEIVDSIEKIDGGFLLKSSKDNYEFKSVVISTGASAMEEALFLTKFAKKVHIVHRRDSFRASKIMQDRVLAHEKINVLWNKEITEINGDKKVSSVTIKNIESGTEENVDIDGVFLAIGHTPNVSFLDGMIELDEKGYIKTGFTSDTSTSVPGIFAAGDVADSVYRQAITAAGTGCQAAIVAERWLDN